MLALPFVAAWILFATGRTLAAAPDSVGPASAEEPAASAPRIRAVVLGSAQDAGVPQLGDHCPRCEAARRDPARRRTSSSVALLDESAGRIFLLDASPEIGRQLDRIAGDPGLARRGGGNPVDGVVLTHAHIGHCLGLLYFGYESAHTRHLPVYTTPRMASFLGSNGPWSLLVTREEIDLHPVLGVSAVALEPGLTVEALPVPHRDELSDTIALIVRGPSRSLLYLPDIDSWDHWEKKLEDVLAGVDIALLDGTFYSAEELPGRDAKSIGHPPIEQTVSRLEPFLKEHRVRVVFTHLNHSNRLLDPEDPARRTLAARGFEVAEEGMSFDLSATALPAGSGAASSSGRSASSP